MKEENELQQKTIKNYIEKNDSSTVLTNKIIDEHTNILLHGCGLGNNPALLDVLAIMFSDRTTLPQVHAGKHFEYYVSDTVNKRDVKKHHAGFWMLKYKMGYLPDKTIMAKHFEKVFPDNSIDWKMALNQTEGKNTGDVFHYTFEVPLKWIIPYEHKDSVPLLTSQAEQIGWIKKHYQIMADLRELDIPPEKFNWWFRKIYITNEDESTSPALWIKGYCTIVCVLQLLPENIAEMDIASSFQTCPPEKK